MGQKASPRHAGDGPSSERTVDLPVSALESHETRVRDARKTPLLPLLSAPLLARSLPLPLLSALRFQRPLGPGQDSPAPLPPGSAHLGAADAALRFLGVFSSSPFLSLSPPASPKSSRSCETQLPGRSGQIWADLPGHLGRRADAKHLVTSRHAAKHRSKHHCKPRNQDRQDPLPANAAKPKNLPARPLLRKLCLDS